MRERSAGAEGWLWYVFLLDFSTWFISALTSEVGVHLNCSEEWYVELLIEPGRTLRFEFFSSRSLRLDKSHLRQPKHIRRLYFSILRKWTDICEIRECDHYKTVTPDIQDWDEVVFVSVQD